MERCTKGFGELSIWVRTMNKNGKQDEHRPLKQDANMGDEHQTPTPG